MARSRRKNNDFWEAISGLLFLAFLMAWNYFRTNPVMASAGCGIFAGVLVFGSLWLRKRVAVKQVNRAAGRQMYLDFTPREFEHAVADLFRAQGFKAKLTPGSGDGGIDILLEKEGKHYGVECKQYKKQLGPKYIRDFIGALQLRKLRAGFFVTTSSFSEEAVAAAKKSEYAIKLIDGEVLGRWQQHIRTKVSNGRTAHTAFIPFAWWLNLSRLEQWIICIAGFAIISTATFIMVYLGGTSIGLIQ